MTTAIIIGAIAVFGIGYLGYRNGQESLDARHARLDRIHTPQPTTQRTPTAAEQEVAAAPGFDDGMHMVGKDIKPGLYRSTLPSQLCYWARLRDLTGEVADVIGNGTFSPEIIAVEASDVAFETRGCGRWVVLELTFPDAPRQGFTDGTFVVGKHIEPGTYRADGTEPCYWARLSNFSHAGVDGVLANGTNPTTIKIKPADAGFTAFGCGRWQKVN